MKGLAQGFDVFVRSRSPLGVRSIFQSIRRKLLAGNRDMIVSDNQTEEEVVAGSIASFLEIPAVASEPGLSWGVIPTS
jgi:hypothetical protein